MAANVYEHLEQNNRQMVKLLDKNRDMSEFIAAFVDHCVEYCNRVGCAAEDLIVDRPFVEGYASGEGEYLKARITHRR